MQVRIAGLEEALKTATVKQMLKMLKIAAIKQNFAALQQKIAALKQKIAALKQIAAGMRAPLDEGCTLTECATLKVRLEGKTESLQVYNKTLQVWELLIRGKL